MKYTLAIMKEADIEKYNNNRRREMIDDLNEAARRYPDDFKPLSKENENAEWHDLWAWHDAMCWILKMEKNDPPYVPPSKKEQIEAILDGLLEKSFTREELEQMPEAEIASLYYDYDSWRLF